MYQVIKEKVSDSLKHKMYNKENQETLVEFRDTIIEDLKSILGEASGLKYTVESILENKEDIHSDGFVLRKMQEELDRLQRCIDKLTQYETKEPKKYRLLDIYKAYKRIANTYRSIKNLKEYMYRVREDKIIYEASIRQPVD